MEVFTLRGLATYYVLFFIHLETRRVKIAGITVHPDERWMQQIARNATMDRDGEPFKAVAICFMIAIQNTLVPSARSSSRVRSRRSPYLPEART